jgi:aminocarboxymuconate-semialdehyde decarboxylase
MNDSVVDFHTHFLERDVLERSAGKTVLSGFGRRTPSLPPKGTPGDLVFQKMLNPELQIQDMDRLGIDINVISSSTVIQGTTWADLKTEMSLIQRLNDCAADWCAKYPNRFVGSFVLPLRDMNLAMTEFERAVSSLGLKIVNVSSQYGGYYLGDPRFRPFWEAARSSKTIVFVHPEGTTDPWFQNYSLWNSVGQPIEEAKVMSSIIYEGIFETFLDIKIVIAHGGGYLPHYFGRLDRNVTNMPDSMKNISRKPSDYLPMFYYDTCTYNTDTTSALIARVGVDRLLLGSDYAVGDPDPIGTLERISGISNPDRDLIKRQTPFQLLRDCGAV